VLLLDYLIVEGNSRGNAGNDLNKIWRCILRGPHDQDKAESENPPACIQTFELMIQAFVGNKILISFYGYRYGLSLPLFIEGALTLSNPVMPRSTILFICP
jgi:hypothetical protein